MKSLLSAFSCLVLVVTLHAAEIKFGDDITVRKSDLRLVGTTTVDLGPVHAWLQKNQGERPLKHWKRLQVFNIKGTVSTMAQCVVKTEDGKFDEILVKNLPAQVPEFMAAFAAQAAAITNLQTELSAHLAETRRATVATASEEDLETYLQEVLADRLQPQTEQATIQEKALALQKLLNEHEAMRARATQSTSILAMNTMRKFINLPVWDCGIQK